MTLDLIRSKFKAVYYPTTQNIFNAMDFGIDFNNGNLVIVNMGFYAPLKIDDVDVHIFNMGIIEITFLHIMEMVGGTYLDDLYEDINSNILEVFIGKEVFDKFIPLLTKDVLKITVTALIRLIASNKVDSIMVGWLEGGNRYDAGIATV